MGALTNPQFWGQWIRIVILDICTIGVALTALGWVLARGADAAKIAAVKI
jgi:hypothetical protein